MATASSSSAAPATAAGPSGSAAARSRITQSKGIQVNKPGATYQNGRYELSGAARGVLVLADPPEAGWRMITRSDEQRSTDSNPLDESACERMLEQAGC